MSPTSTNVSFIYGARKISFYQHLGLGSQIHLSNELFIFQASVVCRELGIPFVLAYMHK